VTKREKRACKKCEEQGVAMAPLPVRIIAKSLVSDRIIIDTIVNKYADHNPLYRQSVIFLRDAGIDISRATMCGWVMTVGEMLAPVVGAMRRELLAGSYIQADETTVDVQMHDRRGKNHQGYSVAIRHAGRRDDLRFSNGPRARRSGAFPGQVRGDFTNRRICSVRQWRGRPEDGACGMLEPCETGFCRRDQAQQAGCRLDQHR
jgi:hypothetical protein